jgi:hypothetical protein
MSFVHIVDPNPQPSPKQPDTSPLPPHPHQPHVWVDGVERFRENKIVRHLVDFGRDRGCSLNDLAVMEFSDEDRTQLAQLIGYSVSGFGDLSYVSDAVYEEAANPDNTEVAKQLAALRAERDDLRERLRRLSEMVVGIADAHKTLTALAKYYESGTDK